MTSDPFDLLGEVASVLPPAHWMLVGGLMVHAHALLAGVENNRPTLDADIVVEVMAAGSYQEAARAIQQMGFEPHDPVNPDALSYRFDRETDRIDLMVQDRRRAVRFRRRTVLQVPASDSALKNELRPAFRLAGALALQRSPTPTLSAPSLMRFNLRPVGFASVISPDRSTRVTASRPAAEWRKSGSYLLLRRERKHRDRLGKC